MSNENAKDSSGHEVCDFCSSADLFCGYLACDFTAAEVTVPEAGTFVLNSLGAWMACRECTRLIEGEQWDELLERSFRRFCATYGADLVVTTEDESRIKEFLRHLHARFREYRKPGAEDFATRPSFARVN
jgi:hypothetical protein